MIQPQKHSITAEYLDVSSYLYNLFFKLAINKLEFFHYWCILIKKYVNKKRTKCLFYKQNIVIKNINKQSAPLGIKIQIYCQLHYVNQEGKVLVGIH